MAIISCKNVKIKMFEMDVRTFWTDPIYRKASLLKITENYTYKLTRAN